MRFSFSFTAAEDRPLRRQVVYAAAEPQPECSVHPIRLAALFLGTACQKPRGRSYLPRGFSHFCSGF